MVEQGSLVEFDPSAPIWVQLVSEFARRIVVGEWAPGSKVPGVRELAADLGVNPNTAQRALAELERQGLCRSERTAGRFVTDNPERIDAERAALSQEAADEFISRAQGFRMPLRHAQQLISERWAAHADHDHDRAGAEGA